MATTRKRKLRAPLAAVLGASIALMAGVVSPAGAHGGSVSITDVDGASTLPGNDFDPACIVPDFTVTPGYGCAVAANDGSSESTDLTSVKLEHTNGTDGTAGTADDRLKATIVVDGHVPTTADTTQAAFEGPRDTPAPLFVGGSYMVFFNNIDQQVDRPTINGGCARIGTGTPVYDQQRHWADGYYKFLAVSATWTGTGWSLTPQVGEYDPTLGSFFFTDLDSEAAMAGRYSYSVGANTATTDPDDSLITLDVTGLVQYTDTDNCANGVRTEVFANHTGGAFSPTTYTGDRIDNVFGLSTADQVVTLPVTIPLSITCDVTSGEVCESDIDAIGGFVYLADNTHQSAGGNVFTPGVTGYFTPLPIDTLGDGPQCPTPTLGGVIPQRNPIEAQNTGCQIDDDAVGYPVLAEFHKSGYGFTF